MFLEEIQDYIFNLDLNIKDIHDNYKEWMDYEYATLEDKEELSRLVQATKDITIEDLVVDFSDEYRSKTNMPASTFCEYVDAINDIEEHLQQQ